MGASNMSREDNDKNLFLTIKGMHELEKMNEDTVYEKKGRFGHRFIKCS